MLLSEINGPKYETQIGVLIDKLYGYESPEGGWPYPFDKKSKPADFVSYTAILAPAEAGRRPEMDKHLATAVKAMLAAQRPEGSWEGDPVYQSFDTPFRATQFAVMALSTLYPGNTMAKNWDAAYAAPAKSLAVLDLPLLLEQLDQFRDLARRRRRFFRSAKCSRKTTSRWRAKLRSALGHMADPEALPVLIKGLGDSTKMAQNASAYAIRMILSRRQNASAAGRKLLAAALASTDARTRWGAAQLFNQHFRDLTDDAELLTALERDLNDSVPYVRSEAAGGLWRWYYWQVDKPEMRRGTLEAIATRLNTETDAMVRRGLEESIYDILDENTGYLSAWVKASSKVEDKERILAGYEAVARDQAQLLAKALRTETPLGREGILNAMWDFHIRHYRISSGYGFD